MSNPLSGGRRGEPGSHVGQPARDRRRSIPGKKNRHRWCRGKVGREHDTEWVEWQDTLGFMGTPQQRQEWEERLRAICTNWQMLVCRNCGKQLRMRRTPATDKDSLTVGEQL